MAECVAGAEAELRALSGALTRGDRRIARAFARRVWAGEFPTAEKALAAARKSLKPRAVNWDAILAFLEKIIPLILKIIDLFT